jgi:excisionase family DNA binding protein
MYENLPELLTSEEACEYLRVTPLSLYGYIKGGKLKAYRIGKRYRIPKDALIAFLEGRAAVVDERAPQETAKPREIAREKIPEPPKDQVADKLKEIFGKR